MRTPNPNARAIREQSFASAHDWMRRKGHTGTVEVSGARDEGGAVFLYGVVIYARYHEEKAEDALASLVSIDEGNIIVTASTPEAVEMFRTYIRYISDDCVMTTEPLDGTAVESDEVEGVVVKGVRNVREGSWRGETNTADRSFFPEGRRTALASDMDSLRTHIDDHDVSGYAVGDGEVVTFRNGKIVDRKSVSVHGSVRSKVGTGDGWVIVDTDTQEEIESKNEDGLLSRFF